VSQRRDAVGETLWETPAGKLEPGESPAACAERELREETGYAAERWTAACEFYTTPGFSNERITLFVAEELSRVQRPDDDEIDQVRAVSIDDAASMIESGDIRDAKTILAILHRIATSDPRDREGDGA